MSVLSYRQSVISVIRCSDNVKKNIRRLYILIASGIIALGFISLDMLLYAGKPGHSNPVKQMVTIMPGQGLTAVTNILYRNGLVTHPAKFRLLARIYGFDRQIKAGEYDLSPVMSPNRILDTLVRGDVHQYKIVIPEGYNLYQIAATVAKSGLTAETQFLSAVTGADVSRQYDIHADTLEGYLFPDTYYFSKGIPLSRMIEVMVTRFNEVVPPEWKKHAEAMGFSFHDIMTLASMIEKETGAPWERPIISSVFHNRLKKKMRLESDPTVIYGIENFDGNLTRQHLRDLTPYNTYKIKGLPAGPIASPGLRSIEAALYPADTRYLYFVSKKNGTHQFSTNLSDHNRAVRTYQLGK